MDMDENKVEKMSDVIHYIRISFLLLLTEERRKTLYISTQIFVLLKSKWTRKMQDNDDVRYVEEIE